MPSGLSERIIALKERTMEPAIMFHSINDVAACYNFSRRQMGYYTNIKKNETVNGYYFRLAKEWEEENHTLLNGSQTILT